MSGTREHAIEPITRVAVVGGGLVGGSVAAAARAAGAHVTVTDRSAEVRGIVARRGLADAVVDTLAAAVADADLVVVAVPAAFTADVLLDVAAEARADAVLTDVASLKAELVPEVERRLTAAGLAPGRFLGGHPMAGSERSGPEAADPTLFQGATWVLTPTATTDAAVLTRAGAALDRLGARVLTVAPELHDRLVAVTSHLPQVAASALAAVADDAAAQVGEAVLAVAGGGFRDTTRIAASDPELWVGILRGNRDAVVTALDGYLAALQRLREALAEGDDAALRDVLARASRARRSLVRGEEARPAVDLVVALDDRPGALAAAARVLGEAGIDVRDLAMRHAGAGDRGALLVRVESTVGERAIDALAGAGLRAHLETDAARGDGEVAP